MGRVKEENAKLRYFLRRKSREEKGTSSEIKTISFLLIINFIDGYRFFFFFIFLFSIRNFLHTYIHCFEVLEMWKMKKIFRFFQKLPSFQN